MQSYVWRYNFLDILCGNLIDFDVCRITHGAVSPNSVGIPHYGKSYSSFSGTCTAQTTPINTLPRHPQRHTNSSRCHHSTIHTKSPTYSIHLPPPSPCTQPSFLSSLSPQHPLSKHNKHLSANAQLNISPLVPAHRRKCPSELTSTTSPSTAKAPPSISLPST